MRSVSFVLVASLLCACSGTPRASFLQPEMTDGVTVDAGSDANDGSDASDAGTVTKRPVGGPHIFGHPKYHVRGTVTGLDATGSGLVLENNGGDDLTFVEDGTFDFPTAIAAGQAFAVTVKTEPEAPTQTCVVSGGNGTIVASDVVTVAVSCATDTFTLGGTVTGLAAAGLVLTSGGTAVPVGANGELAFPAPLASGTAYDVEISAQPENQVCTVTSGQGVIGAANVASVAVGCVTTLVNGSFENGFASWTLAHTADDPTYGGAALVASPTTLAEGDDVFEVVSGTDLEITYDESTNAEQALPATFLGLDASGPDQLALFFTANGPSETGATQDVTLPASSTTLSFDLQYASGSDLDDGSQAIVVRLRDPQTNDVLATLVSIGDGAALTSPMTTTTSDISAFAGQSVRIELDVNGQGGPLYAAFDHLVVR